MVKVSIAKAVDQIGPCRDTDKNGVSEIHGPGGPYKYTTRNVNDLHPRDNGNL